MSDGIAAPAAPAAAPTGDGGAPIDSGPGGPPQGGQARAPDGKFAKGAPPAAPPPTEAPFYEDELELDGRKERVSFKNKEELRQLLQRKLGIESKAARELREARESKAEASRLRELAKTDPDAFMREAGQDPVEYARRRALELAKLEAMDEREREAYELRQENQRIKAEYEEWQKQQQDQQVQQQRQALKQKNVQFFQAALEAGSLAQTHETLFLLAETQELALREGLPLSDPKELAAATEKRLVRQTQAVYSGLAKEAAKDPRSPAAKALISRLGPDVVRAVLAASIADFESKQTFDTPAPVAHTPPAPSAPKGITEDEAERMLRELRAGR